mgnify:CR=1 FL=1
MLSILVTYYNQEKYVSRSLDSIFAQQLVSDFEVLVGDDGSQDDTCSIVETYRKKYPDKIRLFVQPRDLSMSYNAVERASNNRLNLLKNAKGDYVCFLDGDDEYCDFFWLQESIDSLEKDISLVGVAHQYCEKFPDGKVITPAGIGSHEYITSKLYAEKLYTHAGTILFRNIFKESDYTLLKELGSFDDNDITFYFLNYGNLRCRHKTVYVYHQNTESIWNSASELERNLINAIDFEILKKISKYHHQLFHRYFRSVLYVFRNKELLSNDLFLKYKNQLHDGTVSYFFRWHELGIFRKNIITVKMVLGNGLFLAWFVPSSIAKKIKGGAA